MVLNPDQDPGMVAPGSPGEGETLLISSTATLITLGFGAGGADAGGGGGLAGRAGLRAAAVFVGAGLLRFAAATLRGAALRAAFRGAALREVLRAEAALPAGRRFGAAARFLDGFRAADFFAEDDLRVAFFAGFFEPFFDAMNVLLINASALGSVPVGTKDSPPPPVVVVGLYASM
jgi:hypothetical protein